LPVLRPGWTEPRPVGRTSSQLKRKRDYFGCALRAGAGALGRSRASAAGLRRPPALGPYAGVQVGARSAVGLEWTSVPERGRAGRPVDVL